MRNRLARDPGTGDVAEIRRVQMFLVLPHIRSDELGRAEGRSGGTCRPLLRSLAADLGTQVP